MSVQPIKSWFGRPFVAILLSITMALITLGVGSNFKTKHKNSDRSFLIAPVILEPFAGATKTETKINYC